MQVGKNKHQSYLGMDLSPIFRVYKLMQQEKW